jgi:hypothetical protein
MQELSKPKEAVAVGVNCIKVLPIIDGRIVLVHKIELLATWRCWHVEGGSCCVELAQLH